MNIIKIVKIEHQSKEKVASPIIHLDSQEINPTVP